VDPRVSGFLDRLRSGDAVRFPDFCCPNYVVRADHVGTDLKESVHEFHALDVRHRGQHHLSEPSAGRVWFEASRQRLQGFRDFLLQRHRRQLHRPRSARGAIELDRDGGNKKTHEKRPRIFLLEISRVR
jgi:hypothetical protein